jgi:general secretion pathway protein D
VSLRVAKKRSTDDFPSPDCTLIRVCGSVRSQSCAQKPSAFPRRLTGIFEPLLRKLMAASLTLSVGFFTCIPQAFGQQNPPPNSTPASTDSSAASTQTVNTAVPPVPLPNAKESEKAQALFRKGTDALRAQKSTRALKLFAAAHRLDPSNGAYLAAFEIARQQQIGGILLAANEDQKLGKSAPAKHALLDALSLDPNNPYVQEHLQALAAEEEPAVVQSMPMPQFSSGLVELAPTAIQATFHLRASAQQVIPKIFLAYGITTILDDSVPTKEVRVDLTNAPFAVASDVVQLATGTFFVPLDAQHVVVAKDTRENREKFERLLFETVFLPGVDSKEMTESVNMIKNVFSIRQASVRPETGALSIRAPEATLRAVNATLARLYLDKPEVMLDIRVYQLDDYRQEDLGVAFPQTLNVFNVSSQLTSIINANQSTVAQLIASGLVNPGDLAGIAALLVGLGLVNGTVFNQPFALFGNGLTLSGLSFGSTTVNASLNISNTRQLDHMQLRAGDSQEQAFLIGSRYPIVTQSYSAGTQTPTSSTSLASLLGGSSASTVSNNPLALAPTVQYQDLGLTVKATTHVMKGNDVQMKLKVEIAALAGQSVNGSPIITNRSFETAIQVPDGGSTLVTSSVSSTESKSLSGIPGLSELPGFAWTASPTTQLTVGKLLIMISPHIVSATHSSVASQMMLLPPQISTP